MFFLSFLMSKQESIFLYIFVSTEGATAYSNAFYGRGSGSIYLDNVGCIGTESRLVDCSHRGIGVHDCSHYEDAGLSCQGALQVYK